MDPFETLLATTVLSDCLDKLTILGHIAYNSSGARIHKKVGAISNSEAPAPEFNNPIDLTNDTATNSKLLWQNGNSIAHKMTNHLDNSESSLKKLERDRFFIEDIISSTLNDLNGNGDFTSLSEKVVNEQNKKRHNTHIIESETQTRKRIKQLTNQLVQLKKDQELEVMNRQQLIAHLKDQLQEFKAKTNLECKYVKKSTENDLAQNLARCTLEENNLKIERERCTNLLDEEETSHHEMVKFLGLNQEKLMDDLENWNNKCDTEIDNKDNELKGLKKDKEKKQSDFEELNLNFASYKAVVVEDRTEKERIKRELAELEKQMNSCIKIQSWWRGVMVRKGLGEFKKKKGGKGGKKGGKGGKKGKGKKK